MKKLTAKEFALYLGCEILSDGQKHTLQAIDSVGDHIWTGKDWIGMELCKPLLRPLSSLTTEEAIATATIITPDLEWITTHHGHWINVRGFKDGEEKGDVAIDFNLFTIEKWDEPILLGLANIVLNYWRSKGIDCDNLINEGLAASNQVAS